MFLRREFSECNSEVVFGLVFVPFGWPFSLPLISVSQRNPSRVLKFFVCRIDYAFVAECV